jgi:hypothetical protein
MVIEGVVVLPWTACGNRRLEEETRRRVQSHAVTPSSDIAANFSTEVVMAADQSSAEANSQSSRNLQYTYGTWRSAGKMRYRDIGSLLTLTFYPLQARTAKEKAATVRVKERAKEKARAKEKVWLIFANRRPRAPMALPCVASRGAMAPTTRGSTSPGATSVLSATASAHPFLPFMTAVRMHPRLHQPL